LFANCLHGAEIYKYNQIDKEAKSRFRARRFRGLTEGFAKRPGVPTWGWELGQCRGLSAWRRAPLVCALAAALACAAPQGARADQGNVAPREMESVEQAICRLIEVSAQAQSLPVAFLTRLIWRESSFRPNAISPAGAQGVAQFMPGTAGERGLADPFDPEQAIPKSAQFLADLNRDFGNLGLAAAAYNGGAARVATWMAGEGALPFETRDYVAIITHHPVEDWTGAAEAATVTAYAALPAQTCLQITADIRRTEPGLVADSGPLAPWGVQLAGNFSKSVALSTYGRVRRDFASLLGDGEPMVLGRRLRSRGARLFYQVRAPAPTRAAAEALCNRMLRAGGACVVLRS
jgi:Transglycosylase SLT domain